MMTRYYLFVVCCLSVLGTACRTADSCSEDSDCFAGEICSAADVCVEANNAATNNDSTNNSDAGSNASNGGTVNSTPENGASNNQANTNNATSSSTNSSTNNSTNGDTNNSTTPADPRFADLIAGRDYTCALEHDGTLWCWGDNSSGDLNVEIDDDEVSTPEKVLDVQDIADIAGGRHHRCILKTDGTVHCWGRNYGINPGDSATYITEPFTMPLSDIARLEMGWDAACALETDGTTMSCWGNTDAVLPPDFDEEVVDFALGEDHVCAVVESGDVRCWGSSSYEALGEGDPVRGLSDVTSVTAGSRHTCALTGAGTVHCWGYNGEGQCGSLPGDTADRFATPQQVDGIDDATGVYAGQTYTCALRSEGKLSCWGGIKGYEYYSYDESDLLGPTSPFGLGKDVTLVGAGQIHTCAAKEGVLWCWGDNGSSQLGEGGETFRAEQPVQVEFPQSF